MGGNLESLWKYISENWHSKSPESSKYENFQVRLPIEYFKTILPDNYRPGREDRDLTESIKAFGMFQDPVLTFYEKKNCKIIDGEHRILSAIQAGAPYIDVTVYTNISKITFREMQLDSNAGKEKIASHEIAKKAGILHEHLKKEETSAQLVTPKERTRVLAAILERNPSTVRDYLTYEQKVPKEIKQEIANGKSVMNFKELVFAARNLPEENLLNLYKEIKDKKQTEKITAQEIRREIRREIYKLENDFELKQPRNNTWERTINSHLRRNTSKINDFISFYEANKHISQVLPETENLKQKLEETRRKVVRSVDEIISSMPEVSKKKMQRALEKLDGNSVRRKIFKKILNHTNRPKTEFYKLEEVAIGPNLREQINIDSIDDLAKSIAEHGQLQSGTITDGKEQKFEVVTGQRRRLAINIANKKYDAKITHFKAKYYHDLNELQRSILQIHEDVHKPDSKQERANALYKLFMLKKQENTNYEEKTFLNDYRRLNNKGDISKEYAFNYLDPVLQNMVHAKLITFDRSFQLEKELEEVKEKHSQEYESFRNKILYNILTQKMTDKKIKEYINTEKNNLNQFQLLNEKASYSVSEKQIEEQYTGLVQYINNLLKKEKIGEIVKQRQAFYDGLAKLFLAMKS